MPLTRAQRAAQGPAQVAAPQPANPAAAPPPLAPATTRPTTIPNGTLVRDMPSEHFETAYQHRWIINTGRENDNLLEGWYSKIKFEYLFKQGILKNGDVLTMNVEYETSDHQQSWWEYGEARLSVVSFMKEKAGLFPNLHLVIRQTDLSGHITSQTYKPTLLSCRGPDHIVKFLQEQSCQGPNVSRHKIATVLKVYRQNIYLGSLDYVKQAYHAWLIDQGRMERGTYQGFSKTATAGPADHASDDSDADQDSDGTETMDWEPSTEADTASTRDAEGDSQMADDGTEQGPGGEVEEEGSDEGTERAEEASDEGTERGGQEAEEPLVLEFPGRTVEETEEESETGGETATESESGVEWEDVVIPEL